MKSFTYTRLSFLYSFEPYTKEYRKNESLKNTRRLFLCVFLQLNTGDNLLLIKTTDKTRCKMEKMEDDDRYLCLCNANFSLSCRYAKQ